MMIRTRTFCCFAIATMLALTSTAAAQSPPLSRTLEGAWTVTVVFDQQGLLPCAPAGALFTTITPGRGTVIAESCYASEGAGYGSWARTASNEFASVPLSERGDATPASPFASRLTAEIRRKEGRLHWGIEATRCLEPASAWFYANYTENLEVARCTGRFPQLAHQRSSINRPDSADFAKVTCASRLVAVSHANPAASNTPPMECDLAGEWLSRKRFAWG